MRDRGTAAVPHERDDGTRRARRLKQLTPGCQRSGPTGEFMNNSLRRSIRTLAGLVGGLWLAGAWTVAALDLNECPNQCGNVCTNASSGACDQACNYWDEHPADGYQHCVETTCGRQVALPCNGYTADQPSNSPADNGGGGGGGMSILTSGRSTWQSGVAWGGTSNRAVDDNSDGIYWNGSVTHTQIQNNPEWGVNIRPGRVIWILVWNRTDCCADRLNGAHVWIRRASNDHTWDMVGTLGSQAFQKISVPNPNGRVSSDAVAIVRDGVQQVLSLAEVVVWGWPNSPL